MSKSYQRFIYLVLIILANLTGFNLPRIMYLL